MNGAVACTCVWRIARLAERDDGSRMLIRELADPWCVHPAHRLKEGAR